MTRKSLPKDLLGLVIFASHDGRTILPYVVVKQCRQSAYVVPVGVGLETARMLLADLTGANAWEFVGCADDSEVIPVVANSLEGLLTHPSGTFTDEFKIEVRATINALHAAAQYRTQVTSDQLPSTRPFVELRSSGCTIRIEGDTVERVRRLSLGIGQMIGVQDRDLERIRAA